MVFFKVKTTEEVLDLVQGFQPVGEETLSLDRVFGRVLSKDIVAPEDLPGFPRTSVDGYAIRAKDSFGATESLPALLEIVGEVGMGQIPAVSVAPGQAVKISTGGMVPKGADGVVIATEWNPFRALEFDRLKALLKRPLMIDLRNLYEPARAAASGFRYVSVGRPEAGA